MWPSWFALWGLWLFFHYFVLKGFHKLSYLFLLRTWLSRQLPICLVCMLMCITCICFQIAFAYEDFFFYFDTSVFRLQLLIGFVWEVWTYTWLLSMDKGLVLQIFSIIIHKMVWSRIFDSQMWALFVDVCVFVALTSSTRLEYWIHMVLMNQPGIEKSKVKFSMLDSFSEKLPNHGNRDSHVNTFPLL